MCSRKRCARLRAQAKDKSTQVKRAYNARTTPPHVTAPFKHRKRRTRFARTNISIPPLPTSRLRRTFKPAAHLQACSAPSSLRRSFMPAAHLQACGNPSLRRTSSLYCIVNCALLGCLPSIKWRAGTPANILIILMNFASFCSDSGPALVPLDSF